MPQSSLSPFRDFRKSLDAASHNESSQDLERVPFLTQEPSFERSPDLENGVFRSPTTQSSDSLKNFPVSITRFTLHHDSESGYGDDLTSSKSSRRFSRLDFCTRCFCLGRRNHKTEFTYEQPHKSNRPSPLRRVLRLLAIALMLLGIVEFIILACGVLTAFFPDEFDDSFEAISSTEYVPSQLGRWPTDFSGDVQPVACHSHNDYWRKEPLFSALNAGCTGVEADVWLFDDDLFVGHSTASLTPERTLRNLYINPLLGILEKQNPITTFHPSLDSPRNGVFDTEPSRSLVLLIDFKTDGPTLWPVVSDQLQPLRDLNYLTYFNGSTVIEGPITVVATGHAPFNSVVADSHYRDIFFDAPLEFMERLMETKTPSGVPAQESSVDSPRDISVDEELPTSQNQGQGYSGSAPLNPAVYSPANSYYASVDFRRVIGFPWRGHLSRSQKDKLRKQIAGAHSRGLKVRYWNVPDWPKGLRNYLWRVLVREGVDYLSVDDVHSATTGKWGWGDKTPWWRGSWKFWHAPTS
ncbi:hypothetical protein PV10_05119 [Exophiala mesophila]|uniref:Altered inheritance of mitochondria protein 6 n=1 Tax=Exophiala mesophila TaxID=212818 RepID=A0A0D1ZJ47_EXOME|nr:uncharacterized protein PV10_05119 [Exophiala mesophila]KIV93949.1 hypothetical protein PV10_05119 [Exophiala mesophila]